MIKSFRSGITFGLLFVLCIGLIRAEEGLNPYPRMELGEVRLLALKTSLSLVLLLLSSSSTTFVLSKLTPLTNLRAS